MFTTGFILSFLFSCLSFTFCTDAAPRSRESFLNPNMPPFIPSHEWQEVKPGQAIPSGLHVRSNLQTGKTEAKLMDNDEKHVNLPAIVPKDEGEAVPTPAQEVKPHKHEELAKALKNIAEGREDLKYEKALKDAVKEKKYRSYENLKKDFEAMNVQVKSDHEAIADIVRVLNSSEVKTDAMKITLLNDLEYYLHQIDNAQHFADMNGMKWMVSQLAAKTNSLPVKTQFLFALSGAVHSNIKVQIHALDVGVLSVLDHLLHSTINNFTQIMSLDESYSGLVTLYSRAVGVLGGVIQQFPAAQIKWLQQGGLRALGVAFDRLQKLSEVSQLPKELPSRIVNVLVKMLTLIGDLQEERMSSKQFEKVDKDGVERQKQYARSKYANHIVTSSWCQRLQHITLQLVTTKFSSHDVREKVLTALFSLSSLCSQDTNGWHSAELVRILTTLLAEYSELAKSESHDTVEYFTNMVSLVQRVRQQVHSLEDEL